MEAKEQELKQVILDELHKSGYDPLDVFNLVPPAYGQYELDRAKTCLESMSGTACIKALAGAVKWWQDYTRQPAPGNPQQEKTTEPAKIIFHSNSVSFLRAEYDALTCRLDQLRREERTAYSETLRVKGELFEALGCELSAVLRGEDGTALQDRTGTIPVPIEFISESLRFLKDYRDGKLAPGGPNELPF